MTTESPIPSPHPRAIFFDLSREGLPSWLAGEVLFGLDGVVTGVDVVVGVEATTRVEDVTEVMVVEELEATVELEVVDELEVMADAEVVAGMNPPVPFLGPL
jgi:hypothetical protein